jgi:TonB family protein
LKEGFYVAGATAALLLAGCVSGAKRAEAPAIRIYEQISAWEPAQQEKLVRFSTEEPSRVQGPRKVGAPRGLEYPEAAVAAGVEGTVVLEARIDLDGQMGPFRRADGPPLLAEYAESIVATWRFEPARIDGEPFEMRYRVEIEFELP